ncbi:MAG: hypothetical protein JRI23_22125 [Deltaproteobacteria bacterium]|jgi:hypothetical protein|nr:hypothetical protein [Deltaproteobacteria bacterium]MBW2534657.1 hypothetical protein [Deltaproteobacteria bacterium]
MTTHRSARLGLAAAAAVVGTCAAAPAHADDCQPSSELSTCVTADTVWPHAGDGRWFRIAPTQAVPHGSVAFGLVASYISRPIGLRVSSPDPEGTTIWAVDNSLLATYLMAVGLGDRLQLDLAAPVVLFQDGAGVADVEGSGELLPRSAVGDPRLGVNVSILQRPERQDGPGLAGRFDISFPVGDETAFVSSGAPEYVPGISYDHRAGRVTWGADLSGRLRPTRKLAGARIGSQIGLSAGFMVDILADDWLSAGGEASLLGTIMEQQELTWDATELERVAEPSTTPHLPAEWMVTVRSAGLLDGRLVTSLGGGSFIPTGGESPVTVPRFRFMLGVRYVPRSEHAFSDVD